ncbi:MAG TPA: hypothetical protein VFR04_08295 [Solirubrobacterales bacterium]|nr:hypothetical protein [Solirubrobacterales bacterium]
MRRKPIAAAGDGTHAVRLAWCISFLVTLALIALLGLAKSAQAVSLPELDVPGPSALATPPDEAEEEGEAEASEDEEIEADECEEEEEGECEEEDSFEAPPECLLSSAEATVFASGNSDKVRLQVRYAATSPTTVAVEYGLHGSRGSLFLGSEKKRFGRKGVLRLNQSLTEAQMVKVMAAKGFAVRIRVPAAPGWCKPYFDHQLDVRRATPRGLTWLQSE